MAMNYYEEAIKIGLILLMLALLGLLVVGLTPAPKASPQVNLEPTGGVYTVTP